MRTITMRELRNEGGHVIERVIGGETIIVTRAGKPVAELRPIRRRAVTASALLDSARRLPNVDAVAFRRSIDAVVDPSL